MIICKANFLCEFYWQYLAIFDYSVPLTWIVPNGPDTFLTRYNGLINFYDSPYISSKKNLALYEILINNKKLHYIPFHRVIYYTVYLKVFGMDVIPYNVYYGICAFDGHGILNGYVAFEEDDIL